jgi:hypothetical protein
MPAKSLKNPTQKGSTSMANQTNSVTPIHTGMVEVEGDVVQFQTFNIYQPALAKSITGMDARERIEHITNVINLGQLIFEMSKDSKEVIQVQSLFGQLTTDTKKVHNDGQTQLEELLNKHADAEDADGLAYSVKNETIDAIWSALDLDNPKNPLKPLMTLLREALNQVSEDEGAKKERDNSPGKGSDFNLDMSALHQEIATSFGDYTEYVNDIEGPNGQKDGDQIYDLNPDLTGGLALRIVSEFKTEKNVTIQAIKKALQASMQTRGAQAGIFFVNREGKNAKWHPFQPLPGNCYVVVVDKDNIDPYMVRNAILHARLVLLRSLASSSKDEVDIDRLKHLFDQAELDLQSMTSLKRSHTEIETGLKNARSWTKQIDDNLTARFKEIEEVLTEK